MTFQNPSHPLARAVPGLMVCAALLGAAPGAQAACQAPTPNALLPESTPTHDFVDHGDGTVTHLVTGLTWKRCAQGQTASATGCTGEPTQLGWQAALAQAVAERAAASDDWRVPTARELQSIVETCGHAPAINATVFPASGTGAYWSATNDEGVWADAWVLRLDAGRLDHDGKTARHAVRLVRGGQALDAFDRLAPDTHPNAFAFVDQTGVPVASERTSNTITVTGINTPVGIRVQSGEYRVGNGAWTSAPGTVNPGDVVGVRHTSSAAFAGATHTTLTVGDVSDTFSTTTLQAPTNTATTPTLSSSGAALVVNAGDSVRVTDNQSGGSVLTLVGTGVTSVEINGAVLKLASTGSLSLTVVRSADGTLTLKARQGRVVLTSTRARQTMVLAGGQKVLSGASDCRVVAEYRSGALWRLYVEAGELAVPNPASGGATAPLWAGEVAELDGAERVTARYLGTATGEGQGDNVLVDAALSVPAGVPHLAGVPERQRAAGSARDLEQQVLSVLATQGLLATRQDAHGVMRVTDSSGNTLGVWPLGHIAIAQDEGAAARAVSMNPDGSARLQVGGFVLDLAPSVLQPLQLAQAATGAQADSSVRVQEGGIWVVSQSGKPATVFRPAWFVSPLVRQSADGAPVFGSDGSGAISFTDSSGQHSTLEPAPANRARLLAAATTLDPSASVRVALNGQAVLSLGGALYTLTPQYALVEVPADKLDAPFWFGNGLLYVPIGDGRAQGFVMP